jgi:hypothetical protein
VGNPRRADEQRLVPESVRDFDADPLPARAGVHDEAEGLVVEGLRSTWDGLWGRRPSSDPVVSRGISWHENKRKKKSEGAVP